MKYSLQVAVSVFLLAGCGSNLDGANASATPRDAFIFESATPDGDIAIHESEVTLRRSALGNKYLLSPILTFVSPSPMVSLVQPKLVRFELHGDTIALVDAEPDVIYRGVNDAQLLETFPVVAQDANTVRFRWQYGLRKIYVDGYALSDFPDGAGGAGPVLEIDDGFLESVHLRGHTVELRQVGMSKVEDAAVQRYNAVFRLTPAIENLHFEARLSTRQHGVGFFEVARLRKGDGMPEYYAMRWDTSEEAGPITYAISREVPEHLVDAVREGILYWNRVAGRDILEVTTGADPAAAPEARQVIIRWVPFKKAGFAMAQMQAHPMTGELLQGEVFMTDFWAEHGAYAMRDAQIGQVDPDKSHARGAKSPLLGGLHTGMACKLDAAPYAARLALLHGSVTDPAIIARGVRDMVRNVIAHEVGHTLGLRHNFAGSFESELPDHAALRSTWEDYLTQPEHPGAATSTSVMDYPGLMDEFLLGAYTQHATLAYDRAAVQWGYGPPSDVRDLKAPLFCTDSDADPKVSGCMPFDSGRNPLEGHLGAFLVSRDALARSVVNALVTVLAPEYPGDILPADVALRRVNPASLSMATASPLRALFKGLEEHTTTLPLQRSHEAADLYRPDEHEERILAAQNAWLAPSGGFVGVIAQALGATDAAKLQPGWLVAQVEAYLADDGFVSGVTTEGHPYTLRDNEADIIRRVAPQLAARLEQNLWRDSLSALTGDIPFFLKRLNEEALDPRDMFFGTRLRARLIDTAWQQPLGDIAERFILGSVGPTRAAVGERDVTLAEPAFAYEVREEAIRLLSPEVFQQKDWLKSRRENICKALRERLADVTIAMDDGSSSFPLPLAVQPQTEATGSDIATDSETGTDDGNGDAASERPAMRPQLTVIDGLSPKVAEWARRELALLDAIENMGMSGLERLGRMAI